MITKHIRRAGAWLLATGLMLGGAGLATAGGGGAHGEMGEMGEMGHSKMGHSKMGHSKMGQKTGQMQSGKTLSGRVVALKSVKLTGLDQRNLIAMIRTQDGQRKLVDLGPRSDAGVLQLDIGDQLTVRGKQANVRGRPIILVNQARTADNTLYVDRSEQRRHFDRAIRQAQARGDLICPPDEG